MSKYHVNARRKSIFDLLADLCYRVLRAIISVPAQSFVMGDDILLDAALWDDSTLTHMLSPARGILGSVKSARSGYEIRMLRSQLDKTKLQLAETTTQLELARMKSRACQLDIARLSGRVHDFEDVVEALEGRVARQELRIEALLSTNENLQQRNSGLWLINAGLRHDLTEIIIGQEDGEMMGEIVREVEREEWEELVGETLVARSPERENDGCKLGEDIKTEVDCEDDVDAMTETTNDIVDEAKVAMGNLMVGKEDFN